MMRGITLEEVEIAASGIAAELGGKLDKKHVVIIYGVPRGGVPAAYALRGALTSLGFYVMLTERIHEAHIIVDDLLDSGKTMARYFSEVAYRAVLFTKSEEVAKAQGIYCGATLPTNEWAIFPWEANEQASASDIPVRLLQYIGEDPQRGGLVETPKRFLKAWKDWSWGYSQNPGDILKVFEDGAENYDEMVIVRDIPVYSHCEHHLAPFFGVAHIGYIPDGKIVGLSKLSRLVDVFAKRLQVQERLTNQIADAMDEHLQPFGVGVVIRCRHMCMESRGIQRQGSQTITSAMRGALHSEASARAEFLALTEHGR